LRVPSRNKSNIRHLIHNWAQVVIMRRITVVVAGLVPGLALLAGIAAAQAQGIGAAPGVNPSNPQDLRYRSNPQDLTAPGGSNRQDLVRRPPGVSASPVTSPSRSYARQPAARAKAKQKPRYRGSAARR
jgi:hypothetical protein